MQGFDNIINYLTPSANKKRISSRWWSKKIDVIRAKNNVMSKDKPMMKNVLILGYFEVKSVPPQNNFLVVKHIFALRS